MPETTPPHGRARTPDDAAAPYRLPRTVTPTTYHLTLEADLGAAVFAGQEEVELVVEEATDTIVCNAADLAIDRAAVELPGGDILDATVSLDEETERVTISLPSAPSRTIGAG